MFDDLESKIWKVYGNILFTPPHKDVKCTHYKKYQHFSSSKLGIYNKTFFRTQETQIQFSFILNIFNILIIAKNVILGANNTPNLLLKLMYFFCFRSYRPAKYVKLTKILFCIKFQLWTIFFETTTLSKIDFDTLGAILGGRGLGQKLSTTFKWTLCV